MQKCSLGSGYCSHLFTYTVTSPRCGRCIGTASKAEEANGLVLTPEINCPVLTSHGSNNSRVSKSKDATLGYSDVWPFAQL